MHPASLRLGASSESSSCRTRLSLPDLALNCAITVRGFAFMEANQRADGPWLAMRFLHRPIRKGIGRGLGGLPAERLMPQQLFSIVGWRLADGSLKHAVEVSERLKPDFEGNFTHAQVWIQHEVLGFLDANA